MLKGDQNLFPLQDQPGELACKRQIFLFFDLIVVVVGVVGVFFFTIVVYFC